MSVRGSAMSEDSRSGDPKSVARSRVPPNQSVTTSFYTLTAEAVPVVDTAALVVRFWGQVIAPVQMTWSELMRVPSRTMVADMHCVTGWSMLGTRWTGATMRDVLSAAGAELLPSARFAMVHCSTEYTTNVPLEFLLADDTMLAWEWEGMPLTPEHGGPLRLFIPSLYAWKSAKWAAGFEFMTADRPGYWESRGYHMRGDPWNEERYG